MQEETQKKALRADVARITASDTGTAVPSQSRTLRAAWADLVRGFQQRELWLQLGWQDIKQRYKRSVLGPLWITIATGVMALALGLLYSVLFKIEISVFLPHVTVGLILWGFISGCIKEGADIFIDNEGLIKQLPSALSVHVYRLVWKQALFLAHNLVIWLLLVIIFPRPLGWDILLMIPAFALLIANGVWVAMFFGIIATRYRDVSPLLEAGTQLLFYVTPIVWMTSTLQNNMADMGSRAKLAQLNPLYHYLEIVRAPMIGAPLPAYHWWIVIGFTLAGLILALFAMRQWRYRVSYWV
ncbi:ABC transporter permease [Corynebacterium uberis]|uniref:galactan export ABC transporter permease subunit Wzm/RfbD n=1 Tax=Corynebacterium sp. c6VSa_13 TaxID=2913496 RepID=UPI001D0A685E|nr:ABC transporter permease [Corynebacterium uberis]MCZ9309885.1 ABC transporter permease [Corynebacterium sp. c6VSa_13]UDL73191.1 ABC transporter permease [Corynebacterium uberis]UDL75932.1 ABC transporter permease [Corynebacterium uberis]UDL78144.1 ABC transporter permease [Corynebacterium uberis]UDL80427.1 ABC transporter permease [Corynebacterium uberis]